MDLVALEEIRQVKARYLRCVDLKLWDDLADTFTAEVPPRFVPVRVTGTVVLRLPELGVIELSVGVAAPPAV